MTADPTEPQTAAGRALLGLDLTAPAGYWSNVSGLEMRAAILAIEREARSGLDAGLLRTFVGELPAHKMPGVTNPFVEYAAVLDAIDRATLARSGLDVGLEAAPVDGLSPCDLCGSQDRWLHYWGCGLYYGGSYLAREEADDDRS